MKTKKFAISRIKKVASIILVSSLVFSLVGCGEDSESDAKMTTEEYSTEAEEKDMIEEPNQDIDEGAVLPDTTTEEANTEDDDFYVKDAEGMGDDTDEEPATTAPSQGGNTSGKYSYTLYDGAVTINMDVNVDDYIKINGNGQFFELYRLAYDYGWLGQDIYSTDTDEYATYGSEWYTHHDGDIVTRLEFGNSNEDKIPGKDASQLKTIIVSYYSEGGSPADNYYGADDSNVFHRGSFCKISDHYDDCAYKIIGPGWWMSYDDIVILSFVLWSGASNPGDSPLLSALGENSQYITQEGSEDYVYSLP